MHELSAHILLHHLGHFHIVRHLTSAVMMNGWAAKSLQYGYHIVQKVRGTKLSRFLRFCLELRMFSREFQNI